MSQGYDFGQLYGQANMTGMLRIPEDSYPMICTSSAWGKSKDGTKGQWVVETVITAGQHAGVKMSTNITINPVKNDGTPNPNGLGMMFRDLSAFGVPIPVPPGWNEPGIARFMVGKAITGVVKDDEYDDATRSKIKRFEPARPGDPTQLPQQAPQQPQFAQNGFGQLDQNQYAPPPPASYGAPYPPQNGFGPPPGQPAAPSWGGPEQQPGQPPQQTAPGPWQQSAPQTQGVPEWAQPAQPGQGGMAEFTPQGQSYQPGYGQQPPQQQGYQPGQFVSPEQQAYLNQQYGQQQAPPPGGPNAAYGAPATGAPAPGAPYQQGAPSPSDQGQPAMPPWAQQQPQPGYQPQQPGPANPPADPNAAPPPPWAQ